MNMVSVPATGGLLIIESPMSRTRILLATAALVLAPAAFAQTLQLPALSLPPLPQPLPSTPSLTLPPFDLPALPPLPVIPIGPRLQGQIPVQYRGTGLIIFYDTQSPYPVEYTLTGIVGAP